MRGVIEGALLATVLCAASTTSLHSQVRSSDISTRASWSAPFNYAPVPNVACKHRNVRVVVGVVVGTFTGAVVGYHLERRFPLGEGGDDPGLNGLLLGAVAGGIGGGLLGRLSCDSDGAEGDLDFRHDRAPTLPIMSQSIGSLRPLPMQATTWLAPPYDIPSRHKGWW